MDLSVQPILKNGSVSAGVLSLVTAVPAALTFSESERTERLWMQIDPTQTPSETSSP